MRTGTMTVVLIQRSPVLRKIATLLPVPLTALAIAVSPMGAGTAHADDSTANSALTGLWLSGEVFSGANYLSLATDSSDNGVELVTAYTPSDGSSPASMSWNFLPNSNGSFRIQNASSNKCVDFNTDDNLNQWDCNGHDNQSWYLQPSEKGAPSYIIRNVKNDKCMDISRGGVGTDPGTVVGLWDCGTGYDNQRWGAEFGNPRTSEKPVGPAHSAFADLAAKYALTQFGAGAGAIESATYKVDDSTTATLGEFKNVTNEGGTAVNYTSDTMDKQVNWNQTTGNTYTAGGSVTTTAGISFGPKEGPVQGRVDVAIQGNWSNSWSSTTAKGGSETIHIKPNQYGWIMRAQLTKSVTGTWTLTNDLGTTWTGAGSATVPAQEGTDDKRSAVVGCTSDSTAEICKQNDPGRP
ncbi:RICIN domain-containing protein [Streptomyces tubercidicus]|uniref:RICIN domain-containing protein n=1 Tax=Streptomyces tubercidicus TaxID=47759 RepID=UPI003464F4EE